jgi:hypothetical protein
MREGLHCKQSKHTSKTHNLSKWIRIERFVYSFEIYQPKEGHFVGFDRFLRQSKLQQMSLSSVMLVPSKLSIKPAYRLRV